MKTSELIGPALDWAVANACMDETVNVYFTEDGHKQHRDDFDFPEFNPSTDWAQGGPIIERERIDLTWSGEHWTAIWWADNSGMAKDPTHRFAHNRHHKGSTPLIAAMRAFVASKLGDEVEIPAELEE